MSSRVPFPHQLEALAYTEGRRHIALFMEMRLGKSMVAVRWAATKAGKGDKVLVVTYKDCADGLEDEIITEGFGNVTQLYNMSGVRRAQLLDEIRSVIPEWEDEPRWFIINYEACLHQPEILDEDWTVLILDESTALRNPQSKTSKLFSKRAGVVPHRAILSGLPNPKSETDFFGQFKVLNGMFMGADNFWVWRERHFKQPSSDYAWMWIPRPGTRDAIKKELAKLAFVKTRAQAGVGGRFITEKWVVDPSPKQNKFMREVKKDFSLNGKDTNWATTRDIWLQRLAGGFDPTTLEQISDAKTKLILGKLKDGELQDMPALVWFRFNHELKAFAADARKKGFTVCEVYGEVPIADRKQIRRDFQAGKYQIAALQMQVGKFGQDWSRADVAIYYSHTYDTEVWAQTRDRIVHPKQKRDLLLINMVTRGTIDESVVATGREKYRNSRLYTKALMRDYIKRLRKVARAA